MREVSCANLYCCYEALLYSYSAQSEGQSCKPGVFSANSAPPTVRKCLQTSLVQYKRLLSYSSANTTVTRNY